MESQAGRSSVEWLMIIDADWQVMDAPTDALLVTSTVHTGL